MLQELGKLGYKYQFVTLAGFHSLNHGMFTLSKGYAARGMAAYSELQQQEFASEKDGYTATRCDASRVQGPSPPVMHISPRMCCCACPTMVQHLSNLVLKAHFEAVHVPAERGSLLPGSNSICVHPDLHADAFAGAI